MIKFQISELREVPELGQVPVTHDFTIRPEDVESWDLQSFTINAKRKDENDVEVEEQVIEKVLAVVLKQKSKTYEVVEVPKLKTVSGNTTVVYNKEIKEVEKNVVYNFSGEQINLVLEQLEAQVGKEKGCKVK